MLAGTLLTVGMVGMVGMVALTTTGCDPAPPGAATAQLDPLLGTWSLALQPAQRRQLRVMRYVLKSPPPTDQELLDAGFRDDEARTAVTLMRELEADPLGERVAQLRAMVATMEDSTMVIREGHLRMQIGPVVKAGRLELVEAHGARYTLRTIDADGTEETLQLLVNSDGLVLGDGEDAMHFVRRADAEPTTP